MKQSASFIFLLFLSFQALAEVRLPKIFSSNMVLQRRKPVPVWGWADAGEKITLQLSMGGKTAQIKTGKAGQDGKWMLRLDALEAGGPYELKVGGKKKSITFTDVLIGEVWICSGQSNMEWPLSLTNNAEEEIRNANYPEIRHFEVPKDMSLSPLEDIKAGDWKVTSPENAPRFTAVGYFYARELYNKLKIPIGLVHTSWGGTQVESWISKEGMNSFDEFSEAVAKLPTTIADYNSIKKKKLDELIVEKHGGFPEPAEVAKWSTETFDDQSWKTMDLPKAFDRELLPHFDGTLWFRRNFTLPAQVSGESLILSLGVIYDADVTYINGVKVGSSNLKGKNRQYIIPSSVLKSGENTIAVKLENKSGDGGIRGKAEQIYIGKDDFNLALAGPWKYHIESSVNNSQFVGPNTAGTLLYNAMIAPLVPYAIAGAIWYQGESNAGRAYQYRQSFPLMIADWRKKWGGGNFPFYFVQLASFEDTKGNSQKGSRWAELREAQTMTLTTSPNTGMAVTLDIGNPTDIHPRNKQDVGKRLALSALKNTYGQNVEASGPVYQTMQTTGNKVTLSFGHVAGGLHAIGGYGYLTGFEVAGEDQKFHLAKGEIQGDKVILSCDQVAHPVAVRYGWADDNAEANLFNAANLPAVPFRTDTWKGITEGVKFK
ncbi:sialate O-acetylesterase [Dyadobacter sp. LHD-138]|uniref:sialate O-acetylesterase n=1 Tax=Dyadobacter sp. LHD-138 TaxID=3071413 RepID=UPI0027E08853|nr:sialate O-acetylesterase [Dyadobacter sp. LHD-138]MDQ6477279.1 sialate O-acetylesterase [Dyadobacter sp. LHD-138]